MYTYIKPVMNTFYIGAKNTQDSTKMIVFSKTKLGLYNIII